VTGENYGTGLNRREVFTDDSGASDDVDTYDIEHDEDLTEEEKAAAIAERQQQATANMLAEMQQKGREELAKTSITQSFEGEVEARLQFIYKRDFTIGDLVQVQNEYGQSGKARVSEIVFSEDTSGESMTPTFTAEV